MERILGKDFTGPLSLEEIEFPKKTSAVYIISSEDSKHFTPLYVGIAHDLQHRIKQHLSKGVIRDLILDTTLVSLSYWEFDENTKEEAQNLEKSILHNFNPDYNLNTYNDHRAKKVEIKRKEKTRKFTSFVAGIASVLVLTATIALTFGAIFDKNKVKSIDELAKDIKTIERKIYEVQKINFNSIKNDIITIQSELKGLKNIPENR